MKAKIDPNTKHYFQPVQNDEFSEILLMQCSLESAPLITIWEKGEDENNAEAYIAIDYFPHPKIIKLKPSGNLISKISGSVKTGKQVLIKIRIEKRIHYFTGGRLKFNPDDLTYSFEIQQDIFKSQQRDNFRLNSSETIPIQFKINNQVFNAHDISTGGTSFLIEKSEQENFTKGSLFQDCTLRFDRKNYHIPMAQIAILIPIPNEADPLKETIKVGVSFINLSIKIKEELYIKISTEARGDEMKKKFDDILAKKSGT